MLCGSWDGRGVWAEMDTHICMAESLHWPPKIITTLSVSYTPLPNKKAKQIFSFMKLTF